MHQYQKPVRSRVCVLDGIEKRSVRRKSYILELLAQLSIEAVHI